MTAYKQKLKRLRGLPANVCMVLEQLPPADSSDGCAPHEPRIGLHAPEKEDHNVAGALGCADELLASFGSASIVLVSFMRNGRKSMWRTG